MLNNADKQFFFKLKLLKHFIFRTTTLIRVV